MARLYMFVEGQTEQTFADNLIKPHLARWDVFMQKPVQIAHGRRKGRIHRGGGGNYAPMRNDILRFLKQDKGSDVFFTTMIDLYALHPDFPGLAEAERLRVDPRQRVAFLEQQFAADIDDHRFIPYLQLHEFEAYLFADPACFAALPPHHPKQVEALRRVADDYTSPELIDDGPQTAPSKRIIDRFPDYERTKATFGPQLAARVGLQTIREECHHFNDWLTRLESLGDLGGSR
jgi:hypothetical protein